MHNYLPSFLKAILAGLMISIGATAYLCIENHYVGAALFTIGLYTIYTLDFYLFTGKVGFALVDKNIANLLVIWLGNLTGVVLTAFLVLSTRIVSTSDLVYHAQVYANIKLNDNLLSMFILGCFCGLMMFIGAKSFKSTQNTHNSIGGYIGLYLCVMVFLLLGFEHSIANMYYFTMANAWSFEAVIALLVVTFGNAVGGLFPSVLLLSIKTQH